MDAIFALRRLMEKHWEMQMKLYVVFIETYFRVARHNIWRRMRKNKIQEKYVQLVMEIYEDTET